jgi:very-short-patch-repair endonuclease
VRAKDERGIMRNGQKRDQARALRREPTKVERRMWRLLRDRRFGGVKFRRQAPIGPYIADFACAAHHLIVELDGSQHAGSAADRRRDAYLAHEGWRVLRVWNDEVVENPNAVLFRIGEAVGVAWDPF